MLMIFLYLINKIKRIFKIVTENFKVTFLKITLSCNNQNNEFACMVIVSLASLCIGCHLESDKSFLISFTAAIPSFTDKTPNNVKIKRGPYLCCLWIDFYVLYGFATYNLIRKSHGFMAHSNVRNGIVEF